ncbi:lipopolysaccharide biosynthesis protein [Parerythrobacter jejuensis]|uniref:O-antigen/teichoic acid export membrane protein n=1 Tax=Parerythrobacter jejuensis TaxID=795812 RepID=A0A845ANS4_9SPHN|nr:hypothetical protein [Parerythrobacter jejuensis]MXP31109.1 hypothetical protein [Parerythrobacter jejuensis]MXP33869.1 hypothetical protein [Parerythrobacter jejuensis]
MRLLHAFASNAIGQVATIGIALATVPLFTSAFGTERYGCYLLLLAFQPYFAIHQLAAARLVTVASAKQELGDDSAPVMLRSILLCGIGLSALFTALFFFAYPWFSARFSGDTAVVPEVGDAWVWAAALILLNTVTLLQNHQLDGLKRFAASNVLTNTGNLLALLLPLAPGLYDGSFDRLVMAIAIARLVQAGIGWCLLPRTPWWRDTGKLMHEWAHHAGQFGWLTLSALCNAAIVTIDRILLGLTYSATALYFYAVPVGVAGRFVVLAAALGRAMGPDFATARHERSVELAREANHAVLATMLLFALPLSFFAYDLLALWVGTAFADQSTPIFRLAMVGLIGMSISQAPSILLHSTGRAQRQVWLQIVEVVPFVAAIYWASGLGLIAVAWVVVLRNVIDGIAHLWLVGLGWRSALRSLLVALSVLALGLAAPRFDIMPVGQQMLMFALLACIALAAIAILFPRTLRFGLAQLRSYVVVPSGKAGQE